MSNPDDGFQLDLGGVEDECGVCDDCLAGHRVHYASSVAESVVVFVNRVRAGETGLSRVDIGGLAHHFCEMLERRERVCPECCPELYNEE